MTDASAALTDADASRAALAHGIAMPSWFSTSIGAAIAVQIATTAVGVGDGPAWVLAVGLAIFLAVAVVQLARFRQLNGVWLGRFASRVVLGTGTAASVSYVVALGAAIWSAYDAPWLVVPWSVVGGAAYALCGRRWMSVYRRQPEGHAPGESVAWLALLALAAIGGLALLVANR